MVSLATPQKATSAVDADLAKAAELSDCHCRTAHANAYNHMSHLV
jgi:hypothetical protein